MGKKKGIGFRPNLLVHFGHGQLKPFENIIFKIVGIHL
jgi:hypothetical protein